MNKKIAQSKPPTWDSDILPKLKQLNYGKLEGPVKMVLNDPNKIIFHSTSPPDNPDAKAWVTTKDVENGKLEKININATKVPKPGEESEMLANQIIAGISALVAHEVSHTKDFRKELYEAGQDPFPGKERVAEEAEREQLERSMQSLEQAASTENALIKLSNDLDRTGNRKIADRVDELLFSISKKEEDITKEARASEEISVEQAFMFNDSFYKKPFGR